MYDSVKSDIGKNEVIFGVWQCHTTQKNLLVKEMCFVPILHVGKYFTVLYIFFCFVLFILRGEGILFFFFLGPGNECLGLRKDICIFISLV